MVSWKRTLWRLQVRQHGRLRAEKHRRAWKWSGIVLLVQAPFLLIVLVGMALVTDGREVALATLPALVFALFGAFGLYFSNINLSDVEKQADTAIDDSDRTEDATRIEDSGT